MKINKKALFFDIDGTLFSEKLRQVPQSAVLALKKTMEKGNLTFINTGRTWCQTSKIREEAPVNGLLCGCGTYISVDGKTLYDQRISPERAEKLKEDILRFRMDTVMEGVDACFFRPDGVQTETMRAIRSILDQSGSVSAKNWSDPSFSISKFCVAVGADSDPAGFFETLRDFEVIDRGGGFYECVPMGHSKASEIEWIFRFIIKVSLIMTCNLKFLKPFLMKLCIKFLITFPGNRIQVPQAEMNGIIHKILLQFFIKPLFL